MEPRPLDALGRYMQAGMWGLAALYHGEPDAFRGAAWSLRAASEMFARLAAKDDPDLAEGLVLGLMQTFFVSLGRFQKAKTPGDERLALLERVWSWVQHSHSAFRYRLGERLRGAAIGSPVANLRTVDDRGGCFFHAFYYAMKVDFLRSKHREANPNPVGGREEEMHDPFGEYLRQGTPLPGDGSMSAPRLLKRKALDGLQKIYDDRGKSAWHREKWYCASIQIEAASYSPPMSMSSSRGPRLERDTLDFTSLVPKLLANEGYMDDARDVLKFEIPGLARQYGVEVMRYHVVKNNRFPEVVQEYLEWKGRDGKSSNPPRFYGHDKIVYEVDGRSGKYIRVSGGGFKTVRGRDVSFLEPGKSLELQLSHEDAGGLLTALRDRRHVCIASLGMDCAWEHNHYHYRYTTAGSQSWAVVEFTGGRYPIWSDEPFTVTHSSKGRMPLAHGVSPVRSI